MYYEALVWLKHPLQICAPPCKPSPFNKHHDATRISLCYPLHVLVLQRHYFACLRVDVNSCEIVLCKYPSISNPCHIPATCGFDVRLEVKTSRLSQSERNAILSTTDEPTREDETSYSWKVHERYIVSTT